MSSEDQVRELSRLAREINATATIVVEGVPYVHVANVWHKVWALLEPAVKMRVDNPPMGEILGDLLNRDRQLWLGFERGKPGHIVVAMVTRIVTQRQGLHPTFCLDFVGGTRLDEWKELYNYLQIFAEFHGCGSIELCDGRNGAWKRVLKDAGFEPGYTLLRKELV